MDEENTYELIGRATVAWSDVELTWYLIFIAISSAPRSESDATYHYFNSFSSQRKLTRDLASVTLSDHPELIKRLASLDGAVGQESGWRNAVAHGRFIKRGETARTELWDVGNNRLVGKDLHAELCAMEERFYRLGDELLTILYQVTIARGLNEPPSIER